MSISEALIAQLLRLGVISMADIAEMARNLEAEGHEDEAATVRALWIEVNAEDEPQPRPRLSIITSKG